MKILYLFNANPQSGYWYTALDNVKALADAGADVVLRDVNGGNLPGGFEEFGRKSSVGAEICVQHSLPVFFEKTFLPSVGLYYSECNKLPLGWHKYLNCMDHLILANQQMAAAAQRSKVITPFSVVPACTNTSRFLQSHESIIEKNEKYAFYYICEAQAKKNIFALVKAFLSEFSDEAALILKINPVEAKQEVEKQIEDMKNALAYKPTNKYPTIHVIAENMSEAQIDSLHYSADCYVMPSRAESVNLPLMSAVGFGKDVVYCRGSGHPEYINDDIGYPVDFTFSPANQLPYYTPHMNWCDISVPDLQKQLRTTYQNKGAKRLKAIKFAQRNYSYRRFGQQMLEVLDQVRGRSPG